MNRFFIIYLIFTQQNLPSTYLQIFMYGIFFPEQAAIGPIALDMARSRDVRLIPYASDILAISVLAILITAPIGAICMKLRGEYLLRKQY